MSADRPGDIVCPCRHDNTTNTQQTLLLQMQKLACGSQLPAASQWYMSNGRAGVLGGSCWLRLPHRRVPGSYAASTQATRMLTASHSLWCSTMTASTCYAAH